MTDQTKAVAVKDSGALLEQVVVQGDLSKLSAAERVSYYKQVCDSLKLNPLTQPFQYLTLNGKLTLYARRDCTDQLRRVHRVDLTISGRERLDDVYVVTARAVMPDGRTDESIGAVTIGNLKGDALANALMKAETKAKRRVTLSICGLGLLDETEIETVPGAQVVESEPLEQKKADAGRVAKLRARWEELWIEGAELGIVTAETPAIPLNADESVYLARGRELAEQIKAAKQPTEEKAF